MAKAETNENERVKPIIIHDEEVGEDYTLEFNRETVMWAESRGFDIEDISKYTMTKVPELFYYAFRMHHKNISRAETDRILFEKLGGLPEGVGERLCELYAVPFKALNAKENNVKNPKVTVEF